MWKAEAAVENTIYDTVAGLESQFTTMSCWMPRNKFEAASLHFQSGRERLRFDSSMERTEAFSVRSVTQQACIY